ncbi:MAG: DUF6291 domain-containing protein [Rickettsiales bacterium]|nr:DUF6291 domain-containing protein [Rickettsiales bacterium]
MSTQTINSRKSFILHKDSLDILNKLSDEQAGKLFKSIHFYQKKQEIPELDFALDLVFTTFLNQFRRDDENYKITCEARKLAGSKGGKQKVANASKCKQKVANLADNKSESKSSSEKKYNLLRKKGVSKEDLNNALANYKQEIKANSWQQTKRVEFWLTKWETYQLADNKQELKQIESKLKQIAPLADIKIKDKNIIIIFPTFESLRLNKEIINKELTPLCNNIGYTTQLTNN